MLALLDGGVHAYAIHLSRFRRAPSAVMGRSISTRPEAGKES